MPTGIEATTDPHAGGLLHVHRQFDVTEPRLHPKGKFTLYKVTHRQYPRQNPDAGVEAVVWRRFNDFKHLFQELFRLHKALCRPAVFPLALKTLSKVKVFGRFDGDVIEERRLAALELLQFVASQPHLYESDVMGEFLRGAQIVPRPRDELSFSSFNKEHAQKDKETSRETR